MKLLTKCLVSIGENVIHDFSQIFVAFLLWSWSTSKHIHMNMTKNESMDKTLYNKYHSEQFFILFKTTPHNCFSFKFQHSVVYGTSNFSYMETCWMLLAENSFNNKLDEQLAAFKRDQPRKNVNTVL